MSAGKTIADIAMGMPEQPTSGDLLRALTRAEHEGYERAQRELAANYGEVRSLIAAIKREHA